MANTYMRLVCRHCGAEFGLAKGFGGSYGTRIRTDEDGLKYVNALDTFFDHHGGNCDVDSFQNENARDHFIILEYGEKYDPETNTITNVLRRDENDKWNNDGVIQLPDGF